MALENSPFIFVLASAIAAASSIGARADTLNSVTCATPAAALATATAACSATGLYGYANASATSNTVLPKAANQFAQIGTNNSVSAFLGGIRGITTESTAASSSTVAINFDTGAPVQPGYLELTFTQTSWSIPTDGAASESLTVGSYNVSLNGQSLPSVFIPIELGTAFSFTYKDSLTANADAVSGPASGLIGDSISLQAFEADKTTPINLFMAPAPAPEPATLGTMALAIGALLVLRLGSLKK